MFSGLIYEITCNVGTHNISVKVDKEFTWIVCGVVCCSVDVLLIDCHIITFDEFYIYFMLAFQNVFGIGVTRCCYYDKVFR